MKLRAPLLIFLFFMLTKAFAQVINIGLSESDQGFINASDLKKIVACSIKSKGAQIKTINFPSLRGIKEFDSKKIDAYYPMQKVSKEMKGLYPLYIDEVLLISKDDIDLLKPLNTGIIRGENAHTFELYKNISSTFIASNTQALFMALQNKRAPSIIVKRSQIPRWFDIENYKFKTLSYEEYGIGINHSFLAKANVQYSDIQKNYKECLLAFDFKLSNLRKLEIVNKISNSIRSIQGNFSFDKITIDKVYEKDIIWRANKNAQVLKESVINNDLSGKIVELKKKYPFILEAFIFNHQGGLIASINETSDFDQSDEDKFTVASIHKDFSIRNISDIYFDESTGVFQIGLIVRLTNAKGLFSGGLYIGADINKFLTFYKIR